MDIRQEFHNIMTLYGHPVLLIRNASKRRCECWDMAHGAIYQCPICQGTGFVFTAEKLMTREMTTAIPETLARAIRDTDLGNLSVPSRMYYFEYNVEPDVEDYIMEPEWDDRGRPVFSKYSGLYQINHIDPFRGTSGRIEYFRAACKYDPVMVDNFKAYITKNTNIITYNVSIGGI